jgi:hypothetical protein
LEGYSTSRKIVNEKKRKEFEQRVTVLLDDPTEVSILLHQMTQLYVQVFLSLLFGVSLLPIVFDISNLLIVGGMAPRWIALMLVCLPGLTLVFALVYLGVYRDKPALIKAYRKAKGEQTPRIQPAQTQQTDKK